MNLVRLGNDILMFLVEIAMLALLYFGTYALLTAMDGAVRSFVALVLPIAVISLWSLKLAPRAKGRLSQPALGATKLALFIMAAYIGSYWDSTYATIFLIAALVTVIGEYSVGSTADTYL